MDQTQIARSPEVSLEEIEDAQLGLYLRWAEVQIPWWYWPAFAVTVTGWIASYSFGVWGGAAGALVAAVVFGLMAGVLMRETGVTMPRLRSMPPALRRPFLTILAVHLGVVAAILALVLVLPDPPFVLAGVIAGPILALVGAVGTRWYRVSAAKLRSGNPR